MHGGVESGVEPWARTGLFVRGSSTNFSHIQAKNGQERPPTVPYERCFETGEIQTAHSDAVGALWATVGARAGRVFCVVSKQHHHPRQFSFLVHDRCRRVISGTNYGTASQ